MVKGFSPDEQNENDMYRDVNKQTSLTNDKSQSLPNITDDVFFTENYSNDCNSQRPNEKYVHHNLTFNKFSISTPTIFSTPTLILTPPPF